VNSVKRLAHRLDDAGDRWCEHLRRRRYARVLFGAASAVGDFSLVWHVTGLLRAIGSSQRLREALVLSLALGVESLVVNQGIKKVFRRTRPTTSGDDRFAVRTPSTSSFPSGHASSAAFAAVLLTSFSGLAWLPLWCAIAAVVALSRIVVRIHHMTDIVAGLMTGAALGALALPVVTALVS
jgi:undecaprenyl-diphosphatase